MKRIQVLSGIILLICINIFAIPPRLEYTMERFENALQGSAMVALCEIVKIDTSMAVLPGVQYTTIKVHTCYKGGIPKGDSTVIASLNLGLVGNYAHNYKPGQKSILCFYDTPKNGMHLTVSSGDKFDITAKDSILPPSDGLWFSPEFDYYRTLSSFSNLITSTLTRKKFISYAPVLPKTSETLSFRTWITLTGGAKLDSISIGKDDGSGRITLNIFYTPCPGPVCPTMIQFIDTTIRYKSLEKGNYTVHRYMSVSGAMYLMKPLPDDSTVFTVYSNSTAARKPESEKPIRHLSVSAKRSSVQFTVTAPAGGAGRIDIQNLSGRIVTSMKVSDGIAPSPLIEWKGGAANGGMAGNGVYCYRFWGQGRILQEGQFHFFR